MNPPSPKYDLNDVDYARFTGLVRVKSGLEIPNVRRPDLEKAVFQFMEMLSMPDTGALFEYMINEEGGRAALEGLIAQLTIGETHFFRNRPQFEALERHILPEIIEKRRPIRRLRIWSAGCATGEEPYSLAILLKRLLPDLASWNVLILATDINRAALERARKGEFGAWSFREVPPDFQMNYFNYNGNRYVLKPGIRNMVVFSYLNLIEDSYPSMLTNTQMMDLVLCRNVLIYFNEDTSRKVIERFYASLSKNGWLVVGHAEPSQSVFHQFSVHNFPGAILYQKSEDGQQAQGATPVTYTPLYTPFSKPIPETWPRKAPRTPARIKPPVSAPSRPAVKHPAPATLVAKRPPPLPPPAELQSAVALFDLGRAEEALKKLTALAATNPENIWPPFWIAKIHANRLELENAEHWVDIVLEREPLLAPAHYLRGLILQELGRLEQSLEAVRSCLYADPEFLLGYFSLAGLLGRLSQPQRALKALQNLEDLLAGQDREAMVPEGDGLTVGRLSEFISAQKELLA